MKRYEVGEVLIAGRLVGLRNLSSGKTGLWSIAKLSKAHHCVDCEVALPKGTQAFSPITHASHRMERLCVPCVTGESGS